MVIQRQRPACSRCHLLKWRSSRAAARAGSNFRAPATTRAIFGVRDQTVDYSWITTCLEAIGADAARTVIVPRTCAALWTSMTRFPVIQQLIDGIEAAH
jgi:hypothetical protein